MESNERSPGILGLCLDVENHFLGSHFVDSKLQNLFHFSFERPVLFLKSFLVMPVAFLEKLDYAFVGVS